MFDWIIRASLTHRGVVLTAFAALMLLAAALIPRMPVDVFPEFAPPQVQIQTEAPGFPSEDVETLVTRPLETVLKGMPHVAQMRSVSSVGLSRVTVVFQPKVDVYDARMLAQERLGRAQGLLPAGVQAPVMMPMTSAVSWLQKFALIDWRPNPDPLGLRALVDWEFRNALLAQPGVAEVVAQGGGVKQYQVNVDPLKLRMYDIAMADVVAAAQGANLILPGAFLEPSRDQEYFLRVDGRVHGLADIAATPITTRNGAPLAAAAGPLTLGDVASVELGPEIRRGDAQVLGGKAIVGTVSKLWGADTLDTTHAIRRTLEGLRATLPPDVQLIPDVFRQASSIERSITNLRGALIEAVVIVALVLVLLLGRWRPTAISLIAIPTSLTVGALILWALGIGINALTLGGLIFAIGEVVDDAIIDVENIQRHYREARQAGRNPPILETVFAGSSEIRNSVVFATAIVVLAFLPIFFLSELEGRIFAPMAIAYVAAVSGSLLVALSLVPVLSFHALRRGGDDGGLSRAAVWVRARYLPLIARLVDRGRAVAVISVIGTILAAILLATAHREFLPQQAEGNVVIATTMMPGTSLDENLRLGREVERIVSAIPGVIGIAQRAGRSRLDEDAQPVNFAEFDVTLDPAVRDAAGAIRQMRERLAVLPGVAVNVSQFITHRMQEILSGVRAQVVVKVFGSDLDQLEHIQSEVLAAVQAVPGVADLQAEPLVRIPGYDIRVDRAAAALYGLQPAAIVREVGAALNGIPVSRVQEADRAFDLVVRAQAAGRATTEAIAQLPIRTPSGATVPVAAVASIAPVEDRYQIARDEGQRRAVVQWNVPGGDLTGVVARAQAAIAAAVSLPPGYRIEFGGDYVAQQRASQNLGWSGGLSLVLIGLLLTMAFRSSSLALLVALNVPFALFGGALALRLTGETLNVASTVGLIALAGVAARNGILLLSRYEVLETAGGASLREIAVQGAMDRLLPILMTALTTALAVVPLLLGDPVGKEYQRAVAVVLFGGMMSSLVLNLLLVPPLYVTLRRWTAARQAAMAARI